MYIYNTKSCGLLLRNNMYDHTHAHMERERKKKKKKEKKKKRILLFKIYKFDLVKNVD